MTRLTLRLLELLVLCAICSLSAAAQTPSLVYKLGMEQPNSHYFDVELAVANNHSAKLQVYMPVWTPGSYLIREYAKNVQEFRASDENGRSLLFDKVNKNTWEIAAGTSSTVKIRYRVYSYEISVRTSYLDDSHGFVSPAGVFMTPRGREKEPIRLDINPYQGWKQISTGLDRVEGSETSFGAPNFDILVDSPIELGNQAIYKFEAGGKPHYLSIYGHGNEDPKRIVEDLKKIVNTAKDIFGELPYKNYTFLLELLQRGGGGLEHLNSNSIQISRSSFYPEERYRQYLDTTAHEYFHAWNVKRIRPIALGPFDYDHENYTHMLWVAEGFTDYYAGQILVRSGLFTTNDYLNSITNTIKMLQTAPGRHYQSAMESSFDAWIKGYRPNENSNNSTISYYTKGALIGMLLDLEIRNHTDGKKSLDDVMRYLMNEYTIKQGRGYTDEEFEKAAEQVAGVSLTDFFKSTVDGTDELDYNHYLNYAGLELKMDTNMLLKNNGYLGANTAVTEGRLMVTGTVEGSPAYKQGLYVNDEILAINGSRIGPQEFSAAINGFRPGDTIKLTITRDGLIREIPITLGNRPIDVFRISKMEKVSDRQKMIFKLWTTQVFD